MNDKSAKEKLIELLNGLGAISESLWFLYENLIEKGFNSEQAMQFCLCYLKTIATPRQKNDDV